MMKAHASVISPVSSNVGFENRQKRAAAVDSETENHKTSRIDDEKTWQPARRTKLPPKFFVSKFYAGSLGRK